MSSVFLLFLSFFIYSRKVAVKRCKFNPIRSKICAGILSPVLKCWGFNSFFFVLFVCQLFKSNLFLFLANIHGTRLQVHSAGDLERGRHTAHQAYQGKRFFLSFVVLICNPIYFRRMQSCWLICISNSKIFILAF